MKKKRITILLLAVGLFLVPFVTVSCFSINNTQGSTESQAAEGAEIENTAGSNNSSEENSEENFDQLLESEGFLEVFNSFYYEGSEIKEVKKMEGSEELLYILLETPECPETVEEFYKSKKIQSIWSRSVIFEESKEGVEEEFLDEEENENIPVYKFTYYSNDKDKVVNVLIKGLEENRSRIMILYLELQ